MRLGAVFPTSGVRTGRSRRDRRVRPAPRGRRLRPPPRLRPRARRRRPHAAGMDRCLRPQRPVPRASRPVRLPRARVQPRAGDRRPRAAAASDRAGGEAGRHARAPRARAASASVWASGGTPWSTRRSGSNSRTVPRRMEEQIPLLRRLWTEPSVDHAGTSEAVDAAGIAPLPPGAGPDLDRVRHREPGVGARRAARRRVAADANGPARPRLRTGVARGAQPPPPTPAAIPTRWGSRAMSGWPRTRWSGRPTAWRDGATRAPTRWRSTRSGPAPGGRSNTSTCCCGQPRASAETVTHGRWWWR